MSIDTICSLVGAGFVFVIIAVAFAICRIEEAEDGQEKEIR
jgi:hypothetical protein